MSLPYRPCAGIVLVNPQGLIFAGKRFDNPGPAWQMPQGGIDPGETPEQAALRELGEETGVTPDLAHYVAQTPDWLTYDLPPELQGTLWGGQYGGQRQKWFLYRFRGRDNQIRIATEHPEFSHWRWLGADDLLTTVVAFKRAVYEQVIAEFRPHLG